MFADVSGSPANRVPLRLAAVLLVAGAALMVLGVPIDPPPTAAPEPRGTIESYTASPARMDISAIIRHNGLLLFGLGLFLTGFLVTGRGRAVAIVGAVASGIAFADASGAVLIDWFHAAAGRTVGVDTAVRIDNASVRPGLLAGWFIPQMVGSLLGPVLLLVGTVRAGWFGWWIVAVPVVAAVVGAVVPGPLGVGLSFGVGLVLAVLLARVLWSGHPLPSEDASTS